MDDDTTTRFRRAMYCWLGTGASKTSWMRELGLSPTHLCRLLSGTRSCSEQLTRHAELVVGLRAPAITRG